MKEVQTTFYSNTHHSNSHMSHHGMPSPVATDWQLRIPDANRPSGFSRFKDLGHTPFQGQTTLDMFRK